MRIFVLGGSAAQGDPEQAYGFSRILSKLLHDRYPGIQFEVVNTAITATNSHVVREVASNVASHEPDLMIVYLGNNEVVGPFGAANPLIPYSGHKLFIRSKLLVSATKIGQLIEGASYALRGDGKEPRTWMGMEEFLDQQVPHDDPKLLGVYQHFKDNLSDICTTATDANIPLILCTVAVNLRDCPPFASSHRQGLSDEDESHWQDIYDQGIALEANGEFATAIDKYLRTAEIDDDFAELHYRLGRCYWATDDWVNARKHYELARDYDTLRFRADTNINAAIREAAKRYSTENVRLVDARQAIRKASPHEVPGQEMFYEHVHFNFLGNYQLAKVVFAEVEQQLPDFAKVKRVDSPLLSEQECGRQLALSKFNVLDIELEVEKRLTRPPFTNQMDADERAKRQAEKVRIARTSVDAQSITETMELYQAALAASPDDPVLHEMYGNVLLLHCNDPAAAAQHLQIVTKLGKEHSGLYALLGLAWVLNGETQKAQPWIDMAIQATPHFDGGHYAKGRLRLAEGQSIEAVEHLETAVRLNPREADYRYYLAQAYERARDRTSAIGAYRQLIQIQDDSLNGHRDLAILLTEQRKFAEASDHYRRALEIFPLDAKSLNNFSWLLATCPQSNLHDPIAAIQLAESLNKLTASKKSPVLDTLAAAYAAAGHFGKAIDTSQRALSLLPNDQIQLADGIRRRLSLYKAGKAYVEPLPTLQ